MSGRARLIGLVLAAAAAMIFATSCSRDFSRQGEQNTDQTRIVSIEPNYGSNAEDVNVLIHGENFRENTTLMLGATALGSVVRITPSIMSATVPTGIEAGMYSLTLINEDQSTAILADAYRVVDPSAIEIISIEPNQGLESVDVAVTITGSNFWDPVKVTIGTIDLSNVTYLNDSQIAATIPKDTFIPEVYDVICTNPDSSADTLVKGYTVQDDGGVHIISVDPTEGDNDVDVDLLIVVRNYGEDPVVLLGITQLSNVREVDETSIRATVPAGMTPKVYDLTVVGDSGSDTLEDAYTVNDAGGEIDDDDDDDDDSEDGDSLSPPEDL